MPQIPNENLKKFQKRKNFSEGCKLANEYYRMAGSLAAFVDWKKFFPELTHFRFLSGYSQEGVKDCLKNQGLSLNDCIYKTILQIRALLKRGEKFAQCGKFVYYKHYKKRPLSDNPFSKQAEQLAMLQSKDAGATYENLESEVLRLQTDNCQDRFCPICQHAKANKTAMRFLKAIALYLHDYPDTKLAFLMLTITVTNPKLENLRECLTAMNKSWIRMWNDKSLKPKGGKKAYRLSDRILGYFRGTEFLGDETPNGEAHPHFHVLLVVKQSYFQGKNYITQAQWLEMWQRYFTYCPSKIVDIRKIRAPKRSKTDENEEVPTAMLPMQKSALMTFIAHKTRTNAEDALVGAKESAKYDVKGDKVESVVEQKLFPIFWQQTKGIRTTNAGGIVKEYLRKLTELEQDGKIQDVNATPMQEVDEIYSLIVDKLLAYDKLRQVYEERSDLKEHLDMVKLIKRMNE